MPDLFQPDVWAGLSGLHTVDIFRSALPNTSAPESPEEYVNHSLYLEARNFLHGLLVVEDKLSMAHSLENRVPFLDNDLVDFAVRVPVHLKLRSLGEVVRLNENEPGAKTSATSSGRETASCFCARSWIATYRGRSPTR